MIRKARAVWRGSGRAGEGGLWSDSGVLDDTPKECVVKTPWEEVNTARPRPSHPPRLGSAIQFLCRRISK